LLVVVAMRVYDKLVVGQEIPNYTLHKLDGSEFSLHSLIDQGNPVVINVGSIS